MWNKAGVKPPDLEDLGDEVCSTAGIKVLGSPVGGREFCAQVLDQRFAEERRLYETWHAVKDMQCAWQLVVQCAVPRANHTLRTVPPSHSAEYAAKHDTELWQAATKVIGAAVDEKEDAAANDIATLPMRLGGLGIRSAARTAPAAYWASWADALPMLRARLPRVAAKAAELLDAATDSGTCLDEVRGAAATLEREGFHNLPSFTNLVNGGKPTSAEDTDRGEWANGWQYFAAATREHHFRQTRVMPALSDSRKALLRSHSGRHASAALMGAPTSRLFELGAAEFRTLVLERLQLPLPLTEARCEGCGTQLDTRGVHRAACMRTGRVQVRAKPLERAMATVCREAGATVRSRARTRDLNVFADLADERRIDVLADGLPCRGGRQLAIDVTIRAPLAADGTPKLRAATEDGAAAAAARKDKEATYPDLIRAKRCELVVAAIETGGQRNQGDRRLRP